MWDATRFDAPDSQIVGTRSDKDRAFWKHLSDVLNSHPHSLRHILSHWPVYTRRILLTRFLAHYELFRMVLEVPGSIVELGVSRGVSFFAFHKMLEIFCPMDTARKIYGFDSFEGLTDFSEPDGRGHHDDLSDKRVGGWSAAEVESEIFELVKLFNADNVLANERCRLIKGRIQDTIPAFLSETPGLRISLLHLDMDLYEPTLFALRHLWDLLAPGGVLVMDEYGLPPWGGEAAAFDEFCNERNLDLSLKKFTWCMTPTAYVIKSGRHS